MRTTNTMLLYFWDMMFLISLADFTTSCLTFVYYVARICTETGQTCIDVYTSMTNPPREKAILTTPHNHTMSSPKLKD